MIKDILRMAVMTSVLLFAMFAFFAYVAFILRLMEILPPYIGGFMTWLVIIVIMLIVFAICLYFIKRNE